MKNGDTRHQSPFALILIDLITDFDFPDGVKLLANATPIAPNIARLKLRARKAGVPAIYVNDNLGQWRSEASKLVKYCLRPESPGREFVEAIRPDEEDYFVLKPMHSAFFQSPLEILLKHLGSTSLVLCGLATNSCVVCTAYDAKMRDFRIIIPADCCAARTRREHTESLRHIEQMADGKVLASQSVRFAGSLQKSRRT